MWKSPTMICLIIGSLVAAGGLWAEMPGRPIDSRNATFRDPPNLDSIIEANMAYGHLIGLQACAIKDGQTIWNGSYGFANLRDSILVTDTTIFTLNCVSKTVTSAAIMQMWENGLFDLDDDINEHLSFEVHNPLHLTDSITPRMLLTHTSSILDRQNLLDTMIAMGDSTMSLREFMEEYLCPGGTWYSMMNFAGYAPGAYCAYMHVPITLVAHLVEAVINAPDGYFVQHCEDSIFAPLGMNRTCWLMCDVDTNQMAMPYYTSGSPAPVGFISWIIYPAASLKTTALELANFLCAFQQYGQFGTERILDSATVDMMTTVQCPSVSPEFGLGWWKITQSGRELWGHYGGAAMGSTCAMWYCKQENSGGIVLSTGDYGGISTNAVAAIVDGLLDYALAYGVNEFSTAAPRNTKLTCVSSIFSATTTIQYEIPSATHVRIKIYNATGQRVATLVDARQEPGIYDIQWEAGNLPNGVYMCRMETDETGSCQKLLLMK